MPKPREAMFALEDLTIEEGSLVDKGDNPEAHVALFKREGEPPAPQETEMSDQKKKSFFAKLKEWVGKTEPRTTSEILAQQNFEEEFFKARFAFMDSVNSILDGADRDEMGPLLQRSVEEFSSRAKELTAQMTKSAPDAANELTSILDRMAAAVSIQGVNDPNEVSKRAEFTGALEDLDRFEVPSSIAKVEETEMPKDNTPTAKTFAELLKGIDDEDTRKAFETVYAADIEKAKANGKPAFLEDDKEEEKDGKKKAAPELPEAVQKAMEAMQKQNADLASKVEKLEDEKATASFVEKARQMAGGVAVDVNELGAILKTAHEADPATAEKLEGMVKGLIAQAEKASLLEDEIGSAGAGRAPADGPAAELEKKAEELRKSDPTLTESAAYVKAMDMNPTLAAAAIRS